MSGPRSDPPRNHLNGSTNQCMGILYITVIQGQYRRERGQGEPLIGCDRPRIKKCIVAADPFDHPLDIVI